MENIFRLLLLLFNLALQEVVQDGPKHDNRAQLADFIPGGNHYRAQDVRGQRQFQRQGQPAAQGNSYF
jgi:hypothetical protein